MLPVKSWTFPEMNAESVQKDSKRTMANVNLIIALTGEQLESVMNVMISSPLISILVNASLV
jgi:hypothetical protein